MAGLQTSIQLQDRMSVVLNNITASMTAMMNAFETAQATTDKGFNAAMMDSARQGIAQATAELMRYHEELDRTAEKRIPSPAHPAAPTTTPQAPVQPTWNTANSPSMFMNSGADRFAAEFQEADQMAQQLYKS